MEGFGIMNRKKLCVFLLVLVLMLSWVPTDLPVQAAGSQDVLRDTVTRQYDALASSMNWSKIDEAAIKQLLNHAITGKGKHLTLGRNDAVTGAMFNSNLFRSLMIDALVTGTEYMQGNMETKCLLGSGPTWYDYSCKYGVTRYEYTETKNTKDHVSKGSLKKSTEFNGGLNANDQALILVVGTAACRIWMKQTQVTADEVTYHVLVHVKDDFNFDGDYSKAEGKGYDTTLMKLITKLGRLLQFGLVDTFSWESNVEFDLKIPNPCTHEAASYRWEFQGSDLVAVSKEGSVKNELTRIDTLKADGTLYNPYYRTDKTVYLMHDMPWVVEFRMKGSNFILSTGYTYAASDRSFILKTSQHLVGADYFTYKEYDPEKGKDVNKGARNQYGIQFSNLGYKSSVMHTYRLENRIAGDGTNMVYLFIDGEELGPMVNYYLYQSSKNTDMEQQANWFSGKDFPINYIYNNSVGMAATVEIEYVQIWEKGDPASNHSFSNAYVTNATCTQQGYTTCVCKLCGASFTKDVVPARGHNYASAVTNPSCTEQGYTTYTCVDCGHSYVDSYQNAHGHSFGQWYEVKAPSCSQKGEQARDCTQCGYHESGEIPELAHNLIHHEGKSATCVEYGWQAYDTCADCSYSTYAEIAILGHDVIVDAAIAATCTTSGLTEGKHCGRCGEILVAQIVVSATGHSHEVAETKPTCTEDGARVYTCHCGDTYTEVLTAIGHNYTSAVTGPTCTENGYTTHTCSNCGATYTSDAVDALGHSHEVVVTAPTCTEAGCNTYTCHCGDRYTEEIPATGHQNTHVVGNADATCGADGYTGDRICDNCGMKAETGTVIPATGDHAYGEWVVITEPTIEASGLREHTCQNCGHVEQQNMDPLPVIPGDVNGDRSVNARDARLLLRYIAGLITADEIDLSAADYNGDGIINARDVRLLLRYIAGLE